MQTLPLPRLAALLRANANGDRGAEAAALQAPTKQCSEALCGASGWRLGAGCRADDGQVTCPACDRLVAARAARPGVLEVAAHPPADAVTCTGCGTVHLRLACPRCGQRIDATDDIVHGFVFARLTVAIPGQAT